jgi:hypothetical protein
MTISTALAKGTLGRFAGAAELVGVETGRWRRL